MNRQIKFRAWDKKEKLMRYEARYDCFILAVNFDGSLKEFEPYGGSIDTLDWPIMQFTGLLDKNGKEIYEGDVVRCQQGCPHEVIWVEDNGGTYFGGMPGFNLNGLTRNGGKGYAWSGDEEIIGNIYENQELIKILENGN